MTASQGQYGGRKVRDGTVVSDKMQKTILVAVETNFRHRLYKKSVRRVRRLMAHDEHGEAQIGDRVRIVEASPISRHKRWRFVQVLTRAELPEVAPESIDLDLLGEVKREEDETEVAAIADNGASEAIEPVAEAKAVSSPEAEAVAPEEIEVEEATEPEEAEEPRVDTPGEDDDVQAASPLEATEVGEAEAASEDGEPEEVEPAVEPEEEKPA